MTHHGGRLVTIMAKTKIDRQYYYSIDVMNSLTGEVVSDDITVIHESSEILTGAESASEKEDSGAICQSLSALTGNMVCCLEEESIING